MTKTRPKKAERPTAEQTAKKSGPKSSPPKLIQSTEPPDKKFPIVGIGASAGGLSALEAFFSAMPEGKESGMAFVVVQHLAPDHKSILSQLVSRFTQMQVFEVEDGMKVQPGCVYVIPPNCNMACLNGTLRLLEPAAPGSLRLPIDFFFHSLAQDRRERAVCIILSGTGSDGTLGIRAVKGEGGMIMVQSPDSTEYDSMPRSAVATGLVDFVLKPSDMPDKLIAYLKHAFGKYTGRTVEPTPGVDDILKKICVLLRAETGHDFSQYKSNTLMRRVERRMAIHQIERPEDYLRFQQTSPAELKALFRDLLIGVTGFFRDKEAFLFLEAEVIPRLFSGKPAGSEIRVWIAGCSTGEEAYSIAILLHEHADKLKQRFNIQVFATDIDSKAIAHARGGVFQAGIAQDVSEERLARFFSHDAALGVYRVQKNLRDMLIFSEQDVIKDPPFSKLDMISCRNLLIYMNAELQKKLIPLFHYALNEDGVLFLGSSETIGDFSTLFCALDRKWKIYLMQSDAANRTHQTFAGFGSILIERQAHALPPRADRHGPILGKDSFRNLTERALLRHYAKVGVLINRRGDILHIHGRTGKYLEPAPGEPSMNILSMAREGLRRELNTALHRAAAQNELVRYSGLHIRNNGESITVDLVVRPTGRNEENAAPSELFLVIIEEVSSADLDRLEPAEGSPSATHACAAQTDADTLIAALERDLRAKEEYLETTLEELETSNEELRSSNEEMQSVNEELQSSNEELETSKEELQSVNEELSTVNNELQIKVTDLSRANNDMSNLLAGTGVGTLFVDHQLHITRFTPAATQVINLIKTDVGRPVGHIASNLVGYDNLLEDVRTVLDTLTPIEAEVRTKAKAWYLMRIRPYRTLDNVIEGAVLTFVEITARKQAETALKEARNLALSIVATVREPLVVLDFELKVVMADSAFYRTFKVSKDETEGRCIYNLGNRQWNISGLKKLLDEIIPKHNSFEDFEVTCDFEKIGRRTMLLNARRVCGATDKDDLILLAFEDVTKGDM